MYETKRLLFIPRRMINRPYIPINAATDNFGIVFGKTATIFTPFAVRMSMVARAQSMPTHSATNPLAIALPYDVPFFS